MRSAIRTLMLSTLMLLAAGWFLYDHGSRINLNAQKADETLWEAAPGDKWLYAGGVMMLISGALGVAAIKVWRSSKREKPGSILTMSLDR